MGVVEDVRVDGAHVDVDLVLDHGLVPVRGADVQPPSRTACARSTASRPSTSRSSGTPSGRWTGCRDRRATKLAMPLEDLEPYR